MFSSVIQIPKSANRSYRKVGADIGKITLVIFAMRHLMTIAVLSRYFKPMPRRHGPRRRRQGEDGFTLLELLVVLGIIVLVASIAAPQVLRYMGTARTETAKAQLSAISTALELYALDNGGFPPQQAGLIALMQPLPGQTRWRGPYLKRAGGLVDPWGQPYRYKFPGRGGQPEVFTLGKDNAPGGGDEAQDVAN